MTMVTKLKALILSKAEELRKEELKTLNGEVGE